MYGDGDGVEKDMGKEIYHRELAAIGGHPTARYNLGCHEWQNRNPERAMKHWFIAAAQGRDESIELLLAMYKDGVLVIKDILAAALREHQAAVDATKSPQRKAAEQNYRRGFMLK
jgi:TPR repeat protein